MFSLNKNSKLYAGIATSISTAINLWGALALPSSHSFQIQQGAEPFVFPTSLALLVLLAFTGFFAYRTSRSEAGEDKLRWLLITASMIVVNVAVILINLPQ